MPDPRLCLEALSALLGCKVESSSMASLLTPQDLVNIVTLKEFYKQEGFQELEYPSIGTISLQDGDDLYSSPPALPEGPSTAGPEEDSRTTVKINPNDFFNRSYDYDFTNIKVSVSCEGGCAGGVYLGSEYVVSMKKNKTKWEEPNRPLNLISY